MHAKLQARKGSQSTILGVSWGMNEDFKSIILSLQYTVVYFDLNIDITFRSWIQVAAIEQDDNARYSNLLALCRTWNSSTLNWLQRKLKFATELHPHYREMFQVPANSSWCKENDCSRSGTFCCTTDRKNKLLRAKLWNTSETIADISSFIHRCRYHDGLGGIQTTDQQPQQSSSASSSLMRLVPQPPAGFLNSWINGS